MEKIPFTIASKQIKYLEGNLRKDVNDLYQKNYKLLKKEIKEDYRRLKDLPCSWIGRINIVKMAILPKAIYRLNAIPIKIPMTRITEIEKIYPKVHLETQETANTPPILSKKSNAGSSTIPDFKLYYEAIAIKTAWYWHKNRHEEQWNRIEDTAMPILFLTKPQKQKMEKRQPLNKCCWEKWLSACKNMKLVPCLSPCTSINSKGIKDLNIRPETLMLVQERAGNPLEAIGIGKNFSIEHQQCSN
jgi:hypothetical protein